MPAIRLRDRDALITKEGLIFRVFGYSHPSEALVCDLEYAPSELFKSDNPKAPRTSKKQNVFYKFYEDEGWKFLRDAFPKYLITHDMLQSETISVKQSDVSEVRRPNEILKKLVTEKPSDELVAEMQDALKHVTQCSGLSTKDFGVFGSMLHDFHHPKLSDIDLVIYGRTKAARLCETLQRLYKEKGSLLKNEFDTNEAIRGKRWRFQNLSPEEFVWHQRRKMIYALFNHARSGRTIKTEFEPVKDWPEIINDYDPTARIVQKGWVKMTACIMDDSDAAFIPSVYRIRPVKVIDGVDCAAEVARVISYVEEFRMQVRNREAVYVEGNLEEITGRQGSFHQIALTCCPRYYEQVLKSINTD